MSALVAVVALLVYVRTLAPGVTEIDSGELAAVAVTLGIAHPSGYPLFSMLGRVWALLPVPLRPILWMNILSAVLSAGAVLLVSRVVEDMLGGGGERNGRDRRTGPSRGSASTRARRIGAGTAALAFAFHPTLWSVATVTEVHALQMFLDAALLHAIVRSGIWGNGPFRERAFLAACYLAGLCLTNHLTGALLLPGFALGVWRRRADLRAPLLAIGAGLGLLGVSAYVFLGIRSAQGPWLDWGSPRTWETFWRHVTGAQYRVWMFASGESFRGNLRELAGLLSGFSPPLLALAAAGLGRARGIPGLLSGSVAMALLSTAYPLGYDIHDIAPYFLPLFLLVAVWIGLGAAWLADVPVRGARGGGRSPAGRSARGRARAAGARAVPALLLLPAIPLVAGWGAADRSRDDLVESVARSFLATPAAGSVVVTAYWDVLMSPTLYLQGVEGVRGDLVVLDQEHFRRGWNIPWLRRHRPEVLEGLEEEADRLQELVLRFERGEPYEPAVIQAAFEALINGILANGAARGGAYVTMEVEPGIGAGRVRVPDGLLYRLEDPRGEARLGPPAPWPDPPDGSARGPHADQVRAYAAKMSTLAGMTAFRLGEIDRARAELERALAWNPEDPLAREGWEAAERAKARGAPGSP